MSEQNNQNQPGWNTGAPSNGEVQFDPADVEANKVLSLFSYIGIFFLVPMLGAKDSPYARYHVNQGITFFLFCIVANIASAIVNWILLLVLRGFGGILGGLVTFAVSIVLLVLMIMGIVNAVQGKAKPLPVIGGITILK